MVTPPECILTVGLVGRSSLYLRTPYRTGTQTCRVRLPKDGYRGAKDTSLFLDNCDEEGKKRLPEAWT